MNKKIMIGLGVVVSLIIIIVIIACLSTSSLVTPIDNQLEALKANDINKAYSYTSADFKNATSLDDYKRFVDHYPAMKNNKSTTFTTREVSGDIGTVKGTLYGEDGSSIPVEYRLIKEDKTWKILGIEVQPAGTEQAPTSSNTTTTKGTGPLPNVFDNTESRYSIKYPDNWEYEKAGQGTVILSGKKGTASYFSTVNIQTVLTKKTGGQFDSVKTFMADLKKQAKTQSPDIKFVDNGPVTVTEANGTKLDGEFSVFTYKYKGQEFKQWQIVVLRHDGQVFYAWAYTSPSQQYASDLNTAKLMLSSWSIY